MLVEIFSLNLISHSSIWLENWYTKLSVYRPEQARRAPGIWGCQTFKTTGTWMLQGCQPCAQSTCTHQEIYLVLASVGERVEPSVKAMKNNFIAKRTRVLAVYSAVPQPTVPPRALKNL